MEKDKMNKAIIILNAFEKNVTNSNEKYTIFLPKFIIKNKKIEARFPIFNKDDGQFISWLIYDFNTYVVEKNEDKKKIQIDMQEYKKLDYTDEKYNLNLELLLEIITIANKMLKNNQNDEELEKIVSELQEKIEEYDKLLVNIVGKELYNIYFGSEYIITENLKEKELSIEEKLIELSKNGIKKQDIDFEWETLNGLRYVSDESLELLYKILTKTEISLKFENGKYLIQNYITSLCDKKYSTKELLDGNIIVEKSSGNFTTSKDIDEICYGCEFQKCPKRLAGYVYYLINKEMLVEKLEDRKKFRKENEVNDIYAFDWKYGDILRLIPDDVYNFSYELVKRNLIYVKRYLRNGNVIIEQPFTCIEQKIMNAQVEKIKKENKPYEEWHNLKRYPNNSIQLCNQYDCGIKGCPVAIAGIIHYLINLGKEDVLIQERNYYHEHQEEMDTKLEKMVIEQLKKIEQKNEKTLETLEIYKNQIENIDDLIFSITDKNQMHLHSTIEGNDVIEKNKLIEKITNILYQNGKIEKKEYEKTSLQNLAANNCSFVQGSNMPIVYKNLEESKIYVINEIEEFIKDYKKYKELPIMHYSDTRQKQCKHVLKLLTEINNKNYIILDGTEKEIDQLIELDPKLKFVYKNCRFKIKDISLEEIFELYKKDLKNTLIVELYKNEKEFKELFIEYVSLNKKFIPLTNVELASYLAMYSNLQDRIVFPEDIYQKETIEESLRNIIGLESIKKQIKEFEKYMIFKVKAENLGMKLAKSNLHMIFQGNPGTGKTTIARIMAKMLFDLGIIKENKLIEVERKDLVGSYIGHTAPKTSEVIEKAMGGVLFIDEAYSLAPNNNSHDFGGEAIATLIKAMEDHKDNLVVIFAGYKDEMKKFIDSNQGIESRIGYTFEFSDYTVAELVEIFYKKIEKMGFKCSKECDLELKKVCEYFSKRKAFGNGRFVDKLIQEVIMKHALNNHKDIKKIEIEDIPTIKEFNHLSEIEENTEDLLKNVIGLEKLKEKIKEFEQYVKFLRESEKNNIKIPNQNMHMIFTGNPGTGKTTIARIMAKILYNAGILQENKLIEVERKDLIAGYVGQTAPKTMEVIEKAMGGVLFIDEAYSLTQNNNSHDFGGEAIATLIKAMEDHKGEFVVIFAGYQKEMSDFINVNSGIASRIGYTFHFEDYTREELAEILYKKIEKSNLKIEEKAKDKVFTIMNYFCNVENIGNGRFVDRVFQETLLKHSKNKKAKLDEIKEEDIPTIEEMTNCLFEGQYMIKPDKITDKALEETAIHEIGHAFIRYKLFDNPGIMKITINPEGNGRLGYVQYKIIKEGYVQKKSMLLNRIKVSLAGMIAEEVFTGEFANGNTSDLEKATRIAENMITKYGMSSLGYGQIDKTNEVMGIKIQEEIRKILNKCYEETTEIIKNNKDLMQKVVDYLLEHKEIDEEQFINILEKNIS